MNIDSGNFSMQFTNIYNFEKIKFLQRYNLFGKHQHFHGILYWKCIMEDSNNII